MEIEKNGHSKKSIIIPPVEEGKPLAKAKPEKADTAGRAQKVIMIPPIKAVTTTITIQGISPLIVNAWSEKAKQMMRAKQTGAPKEKSFKEPEEDFKASRYIDAQGRDCIPAVALKSCAVEAGVICGVFKTTLRKAFFVIGELIPIEADEPIMREDMVRVGQGVADIRYRACYQNWSVKIPVEFQPRMISAEQLFNLFDNGGYSVGIGEWRPEHDGQYGRFRVAVSK
jgi:hypothetical protein